MIRRPIGWKALFSKRFGKIFLYSWLLATLVFICMAWAISFVSGGFALFKSSELLLLFNPIIILLFLVYYAAPAFFVALCVALVSLFCADADRSENIALTICSIVYGLLLGIPSSGNLITIGLGAATGFLSAVVALIMTKDLRVGLHVDRSWQ